MREVVQLEIVLVVEFVEMLDSTNVVHLALIYLLRRSWRIYCFEDAPCFLRDQCFKTFFHVDVYVVLVDL